MSKPINNLARFWFVQGLMTLVIAQLALPATAQNVVVYPNEQSYPTLKAAFDAINDGVHQGTVHVSILQDTEESATAVLRASGTGFARYDSLEVSPIGERTVAGDPGPGVPLIDLQGARYATIRSDSNSTSDLTIINRSTSALPDTATIRFSSDARDNLLLRLRIVSGSRTPVGMPGGAIVIGRGDGGAGNDGNLIAYNRILPLGPGAEPTQGFYCSSGAVDPARANSGNEFRDNLIEDVFSPDSDSAAVRISGGCRDMIVSTNRIYQTTQRVFIHPPGIAPRARAIDLFGTDPVTGIGGIEVRSNTIGFPDGTGILEYSGGEGGFVGIRVASPSSGTRIVVDNNIIGNVYLGPSQSSGTGIHSPFAAILVERGQVHAVNNRIGGNNATAPLFFETSTNLPTDVYGIAHFGAGALVANQNVIGAFDVRSTAAVSPFRLVAISARAGQGESLDLIARNNSIGEFIPGALANNTVTQQGGQLIGIDCHGAKAQIVGNSLGELTARVAGGAGEHAAIQGIRACTGNAPAVLILGNTIVGLESTSMAPGVTVQGIYSGASNGQTLISGNRIRGLKAVTMTGLIDGIRAFGNPRISNNMITLGKDRSGTDLTTGLEITGIGTSGSIKHNSILIMGNGVTGNGRTTALALSSLAGESINNILVNRRSNGTGTGRHHAIVANVMFLSSFGNNLQATGNGGFVGRRNNVDFATLADWQQGASTDATSVSTDPGFVSETDLHLTPASAMLGLVNLSTDVTRDFDGTDRTDPQNAVDIGADEIGPALPSGHLIVQPQQLRLGHVVINSVGEETALLLENHGDAPIQVLEYGLFKKPPTLYGDSGSCPGLPFELDAGEGCHATFRFAPSSPGEYQRSTAVLAGLGQSYPFLASGTVADVSLSAQPASLDFGFVKNGRVVERLVTLTNPGTEALDVVAISGQSVAFDVEACSALPIRLEAGAECAVTVRFSPNSISLEEARIVFSAKRIDGDPVTALLPVLVKGRSVSQALVIAPGIVSFGGVTVGDTGVPVLVTLANAGSATLNLVFGPQLPAPFFLTNAGTCSQSGAVEIHPGDQCTLEFGFTPSSQGWSQHTIVISGVPAETPAIVLGGEGLLPASIFENGFE